MNPIVVTYIGFFVVVLILMWAVIELGRRYSRQKKVNTRIMNTLVPLRPIPLEKESAEDSASGADDEQEERTKPNIHTRAQQNGHYSESKKPL